MRYVNLKRCFAVCGGPEKGGEDVLVPWGAERGFLHWDELLTKRRVVVLAEASSGKSREFQESQKVLKANGSAAFYVTIEDLVDRGLLDSLSSGDKSTFEEWLTGFDEACFFLDSVDEARLNRKKFLTAIRNLERGISSSLVRAHIFISCRVSDWKGDEDERVIRDYLPILDCKSEDITVDCEKALLDPLFSKDGVEKKPEAEKELPVEKCFVVRLVPLDQERQKILAQAVGVTDCDEFSAALWKTGLEQLSDRPGDIISLAEYWNEHGTFASLSAMTGSSIEKKLSELDKYRPDNDSLSLEKAQQGAERLAAALTLGKTFSLKAPGQDPDPKLAIGALDSVSILRGWSDAERMTLLRKGIFAPSTYGRIRFHHRLTQEYLTAKWFHRLLTDAGCTIAKVSAILFADTYGVMTVVPSLQKVAAWLAIDHHEICEEILKREPLLLIQYGDPGSLSIADRKKLLRFYAEKYEAGEIAKDWIESRFIWMFADTELAETISDVWNKCERHSFRGELLEIIKAGKIKACEKLVEEVALNRSMRTHDRLVAIEAIDSWSSESPVLTCIADHLKQHSHDLDAIDAAHFACALFPEYLDISDIEFLIRTTRPPNRMTAGGFGYALDELWGKCPDALREPFVLMLTLLVLEKPFVADYQRISARFNFLAKHFEPLARDLIEKLGSDEPSAALLRLLMAIERVRDSAYSMRARDLPPLSKLVQANKKLLRLLFWADVNETRKNSDRTEPTSSLCHLCMASEALWNFNESDLAWLYDDILSKSSMDDKRIALSVIINVLRSQKTLVSEAENLRIHLKEFPPLLEELELYLRPPEEWEQRTAFRLRAEEVCKKEKEKEAKDKESWKAFRAELIRTPAQVTEPEHRFKCIHHLTIWLRKRTKQGPIEASLQWRLLEEAFNSEVAHAYQTALKLMWRESTPKRPRWKKNGVVTTRYSTIYSMAGLGVEANEDSQWVSSLSREELILATEHGCVSDQGYPAWLDQLLQADPHAVIPIIMKQFRREWTSPENHRSDFLSHFSNVENCIHREIEPKLFEFLARSEPLEMYRLIQGIEILQRLQLSSRQLERVKRMAEKRMKDQIQRRNMQMAQCYLVLLFHVSSEVAMHCLTTWLERTPLNERNELALQIFGGVFNLHGNKSSIAGMENVPVKILRDLVCLAYHYIGPATGIEHREGRFSPDLRENAEFARSALLSRLTALPGEEAYRSVQKLGDEFGVEWLSHRFRQIAHGMAERDSECTKWLVDEVIALEEKCILPIKNGDDLYQVVRDVLNQIEADLQHSDASPKKLLGILGELDRSDEESVQNWIAHELKLRSDGRYHVHREAEVANQNEPDLIVSGATAQVEVAIEVKQADSWSTNELREALTAQLAEKYLRPNCRRHGVLFMTDHGRKGWKHPETRKNLTFSELLDYLECCAKNKDRNATGKIDVSVHGFDCRID